MQSRQTEDSGFAEYSQTVSPGGTGNEAQNTALMREDEEDISSSPAAKKDNKQASRWRLPTRKRGDSAVSLGSIGRRKSGGD